MKNNIGKLIVVLILLAGAMYYGYTTWKKLQPPPPQSRPYAPMMPPGPVSPAPQK